MVSSVNGFSARRPTVTTRVRGVSVGSSAPIVVQSMTNTDTADAAGTADQVAALFEAGSQKVRITVNNDEAAQAVPEIRQRLTDRGLDVPLIGDFHYNGHLLLTKYPACAAALDKYRINPGNVGSKHRDTNFTTIVQAAIDHDKPVRIGVNWGSLDQMLLTDMMDSNAKLAAPRDAKDVYMDAMLESALCIKDGMALSRVHFHGLLGDLIVIDDAPGVDVDRTRLALLRARQLASMKAANDSGEIKGADDLCDLLPVVQGKCLAAVERFADVIAARGQLDEAGRAKVVAEWHYFDESAKQHVFFVPSRGIHERSGGTVSLGDTIDIAALVLSRTESKPKLPPRLQTA